MVFSSTTLQWGNWVLIASTACCILLHILGCIHFFLSHSMISLRESDCVNSPRRFPIETSSYFTLSVLREGNDDNIMNAAPVLKHISDTLFALVTPKEVRNKHFLPRFNRASAESEPNSWDPCMFRLCIICNLLLTAFNTSSPVLEGISRDRWHSTDGRALMTPSTCAESHRNDGVYFTLFNEGKLLRQPAKYKRKI